MRSIKFYISMAMIIGFFLSVNSISYAKERYNIDVTNIKQKAGESKWLGDIIEVESNVTVRNKTDKTQKYKIEVYFLNSNNDKISKVTKKARISPNQKRIVSQKLNLRSFSVREIESAYVVVSNAEKEVNDYTEQTIATNLGKNINVKFKGLTRDSVELKYLVKLRNNTDKTMTRNVTVAFLDAENNQIESETTKAAFNAGELKMIADTLKLSTADAEKISTGHVTIN